MYPTEYDYNKASETQNDFWQTPLVTVNHILVDTAEIREQYFNCTDLKTLFNNVAGNTILVAEILLVDKI